MAENPIKNTDFYAGDGKPFEAVVNNLLALEEQAGKTLKKISDLARVLKSTGNPTDAASMKEQIALMKDLEKEQKKLITLEQQRAYAEKELALRRKQAIDDSKAEREERKKATNEYQKQSKTLNDLRKEYKDLALAEKENTKEAKDLLRQITQLDKKLKDVDATVGQHQRNVGNYTSAWDKAKNVIGKMSGVFAAVRGSLWIVNKAIEASGALTDKWEKVTAQANAGWNIFAQSLGNWDWDSFTDKFLRTIDAAGKYAEKLVDIQEQLQVTSVQEKLNRLEIVKLKEDLSNVNLAYSEREKIAKRIIKLEDDGAEKTLELLKKQRDENVLQIAVQTKTTEKYVKSFFTRLRTDKAYLKSIEDMNTAINSSTKISRFSQSTIDEGAEKLLGKNKLRILKLHDILNGLSNDQKDRLIEDINNVTDKEIEVQTNKNSVYKRLNTLLAKDEKATQKEITSNFKEEIANRKKIRDDDAKEYEEIGKDSFQRQYDTRNELVKSELDITKDLTENELQLRQEANIKIEGYWQDTLKKQLDDTQIYADASMDILDTVSNFQQAAMNKELAAAGDNAAKQEEIRKKYAKKEQQNAIAKAVINGALAVGNALVSTPFPLPALVFAGLAAAKTASEIAVIKSVKFAKGGSWVEGGRLHSQGGNKYGDKELEQGEAVGVLSRKATKKHGKDFANVVDAFNNDSGAMLMPDIMIKDDNFKHLKDIAQLNRMLLNEQKSLNSHIKNQVRQLAPGVYVDGKGNKINIV